MCPPPNTGGNASSKGSVPEFTLAEIAEHKGPDDAWLVVDGVVLDASKFLRNEGHPGGEVLKYYFGQDVTDVFAAYHPEYVRRKKFPKYKIGVVKDAPPLAPIVKDFREMRSKMEKDGLFKHDWRCLAQLAGEIAFPLALIGASVYLFGTTYFPLHILAGLLVGLAQHQAAFVGHDGAHGMYTGNWGVDTAIGILVATVGFGVSVFWWKYTHNQHHVVTNEYDRDTDVTHLPFYAVSKHMLLSKEKGKKLGTREHAFARFMVSVQAFTFVPIMLIFARFSLMINATLVLVIGYVPSIPHQHFHHSWKWRLFDGLCIVAHLVWNYAMFCHVAPEGSRLASWFCSWVIVSMLHIQLVGNHWDRPTKYSGDEKENWFVKEVITGRNYTNSWWSDVWHGGLEMQVEHHIFPRMPRHAAVRCRDEYVLPLCRKHNIPYCVSSCTAALGDILKVLAVVGEHAYDHMY